MTPREIRLRLLAGAAVIVGIAALQRPTPLVLTLLIGLALATAAETLAAFRAPRTPPTPPGTPPRADHPEDVQ